MTGPEQHANTVRDALHGDRVTDPVENWAAADRALDALVALAEWADTLERELDDLRFWNNRVRVCENHTDEVAAPVADCLVCELTEARGEADRLREALRFYADPANWRQLETMGASSAALDRGMDARAALAVPTKAGVPAVPCVDCTHDYCRCAALAGPQTEEQP